LAIGGKAGKPLFIAADWIGISKVLLEEYPFFRCLDGEYSSPGRRIFSKKTLEGAPGSLFRVS
jgi:hypothetical protein